MRDQPLGELAAASLSRVVCGLVKNVVLEPPRIGTWMTDCTSDMLDTAQRICVDPVKHDLRAQPSGPHVLCGKENPMNFYCVEERCIMPCCYHASLASGARSVGLKAAVQHPGPTDGIAGILFCAKH
jgi:hypothetical protein